MFSYGYPFHAHEENEWRLLIDSLNIRLKAALIQSGKIPSVPLAHAKNIKKFYKI